MDDEQAWIDGTRATFGAVRDMMRLIEESHTDPAERWMLLRESLTRAVNRRDDEVRASLGIQEAMKPWH